MSRGAERKERRVRRFWIEAFIVGCSIGLVVILLKFLFSESGMLVQVVAFLASGVALCLVQAGVSRWRR